MRQKKVQENNLVEEVASFSQQEIEEIRQEAIRKAKSARHKWRQKGRWLVCKSCEFTHAIWIGNKVMVGEDKQDNPILKDKEEVFKK